MKKSIFITCIIVLLMLLPIWKLAAENRLSSYAIYGPLRVSTILPPEFSLPGGTYDGTQIITLQTNAGPNARIRYTTNLMDPTMTFGILYSGPIVISQTTVLKAIVYLQGVSGSQSIVRAQVYTITYAANTAVCGPLKVSTIQPPAFSIAGGEYQEAQTLVLSTQLGSNARIRYTMDGSEPSMYSGILYGAPIVIGQDTSIKAVTYLSGVPGSASIVASEFYHINSNPNSILNLKISSTDGTIPITKVKLSMDIGPSIQKELINNQVSFKQLELISLLLLSHKIKKISLFDNNTLIGHIDFEYTMLDLLSGKKYDLRLFVHEQHLPYTPETGGNWKYYEPGERMVSMLVEPPTISQARAPMVLVHGVGGSFPAFGRNFIKQLNGNPNSTADDTNDIWEFYYPYDQHIERSAPLLGNAIQNIRQYYLTSAGPQRVDVIGHSMGGLVTRTYIQNSPSSDTGIRKFLMLGTPNHGSHSSFRIRKPFYYSVSTILNEILVNIDEKSPAVSQMHPGSAFLTQLNSEAPKSLYPGSNIQNDYLVLAGTKNEPRYFLPEFVAGWEHYLPNSNDDIVVSTASASLLEWGIPLALVDYNHQGLHGTTPGTPAWITNIMNPDFLATFFHSNYNAGNHPFGPAVDNFYLSPPEIGNHASLIQVKFNKPLNSKMILFQKEGLSNSLKLTFVSEEEIEEEQELDERLFIGYSNRLRKCDFDADASYYFLEQVTFHRPPQLFVPYPRYGQTANLFPGIYDLTLYNRKGKPFKTIYNGLHINNLATSSITINLSDGDVAHTMLDNINNPNQTRHTRDGANRFIEKEYYLDSTVNSTIFYIGDEDASPDFAFHNACLIDPLQNVIDHTTPASNPDIEFHEDISSGFAYYYVKNPQPGL